MKNRIILLTLLFSLLFVPVGLRSAPLEEKFELPSAVKSELKRLEETYHVLDHVAEKVWPGWSNYRDFPFLFHFENGLSVLIGHPNPPEGFELLPDVQLADKKIYVDRRNITPLELKQPLSAGGGILPYGTTEDGESISVVSIDLNRIRPSDKDKDTPPEFKTEDQIVMYIHELFHCFQKDHVKIEYGNFRFNPDTEYAVYSEIEGMALDKSYQESDKEKAKKYLKDFMLAREMKRKGMSEDFQNEESSDEVREGTAVYSEVRTLEILKEGFKADLTSEEDPYYGQFKEIDSLILKYVDSLREASKMTYGSFYQRYRYGCFQALLLQRLFPGWQEPFSKEASYLDEEIKRRIPVSEKDFTNARKRFKKIYGIKEVKKRHQKAIKARDKAYKQINSRKGKSYIISFKNISQYLGPIIGGGKQSYQLGLIYLYPQGIGTLKVDDIEIVAQDVPTEINQLYYLKFVDTDWEKRGEAYTLKFEKKEGEDIFEDVVMTTPLFTLKAPKIRIKEKEDRVKIWILSRI